MAPKKKPLNRVDFEVVCTEILPDGRIKMTMRNGAIGYAAPLPGGDWLQRKSREICDIQYGIILRQMREAKTGETGTYATAPDP